ncbi:hypothetical protein GGI21_002266 [Coemansia aciculifera]|nr:hypothetical protein GGI21_002266 [Coemansia aciculifera]
MVHCSAGHMLCFGCIQDHVRALLVERPSADAVFCLCAGCHSYVPSKFLRQCLSPQRFKQIVDNCVQGFQARQLAKRSASFGVAGDEGDAASAVVVRPLGLANLSEEGFDAPIIVDPPPPSEPLASKSVVADIRGLAQAVGGLPVSEQQNQVFSASMPALPRRAVEADQQPLMIVSEFTSIERASMNSVVFAASVAADSSLTLSPESVGSRLRRVAKAQENVRASPGSHSTGAFEGSPASVDKTPEVPAVYDYADMDLDAYMRTPQPPQIPLFAASPMSWSPVRNVTPTQTRAPPQQQMQPPPIPLPSTLPAHFRASATWITPEQRYSGYTENILLNATLFETIRRQPSPVDWFENEGRELLSDDCSPRAAISSRMPVPSMVERKPADDDASGVYIPTWRRADDDASRVQYQMPLWAGSEFGSQSGVLCEAAELNFDLYETLHRRR